MFPKDPEKPQNHDRFTLDPWKLKKHNRFALDTPGGPNGD